MHNLSTSSHATPIEFTHTDYHLVNDPSQQTVVDLGSRIPLLAVDTTLLAPENPKTKLARNRVSLVSLVLRRMRNSVLAGESFLS